MAGSVIQLKCDCNNYPWGKTGNDSMAARLCANTPGTDFKLDPKTDYAEMWMGTYPTTPAYVLSNGELLQDVLSANKESLLGKNALKKFDDQLPFLPKILSIAKALPLQIHPNKSLAAQLHKQEPEKFSDSNHKPEIAVALGPFEVFAGFKPTGEIDDMLKLNPLLRFRPKDTTKIDSEAIRDVCRDMLEAPEEQVRSVTESLANLVPSDLGRHAYIYELLPRIQKQYGPEDNGILVALVCMNYMKLDAGDALYVPADGIHAYLSGDIIECMARSDNVLNTGFCPRGDRDNIDLFTKTLTFKSVSKDEMLLPSVLSDLGKLGKTRVYKPALSEFDMLVTTLGGGEKEQVAPIDGPSIMIVTQGRGVLTADGTQHTLDVGYIFFVGHGVSLEFKSDKGLVVYRAYAE